MPTLMMANGPSACGKTHYFENTLMPKGNWARVGRDFLRKMLFNSSWTKNREKITVDVQKAIVRELGLSGQNIYIDDTNLTEMHEQRWRSISEELRYNFWIKKFHRPIKAALMADSDRDPSLQVGPLVINNQYLLGGFIDWAKKPIVLVDLDHTLTDPSHRKYILEEENPDFKEYARKCYLDAIHSNVLAEIYARRDRSTICITTGRDIERYGEGTLRWLSNRNIPHDYIFMADRRRLNHETKKGYLDLIRKQVGPDHPIVSFEDNPDAIAMYQADPNVTVYQCQNGKITLLEKEVCHVAV